MDIKMTDKIYELIKQSEVSIGHPKCFTGYIDINKFTELIVRECADICMEMATKCAGLEGDGALAKDCAYWIKKDFGVEE